MNGGLLAVAASVGAKLKARGETVAVCESAAGGLICAALLAAPGASSWCIGGTVIYSRQAFDSLRDFRVEELGGFRSSTEGNALIRARLARGKFQVHWGVGETGAAGPTGNRYGDPAGHAWLAVCGGVERTRHLSTGSADRQANMQAFAQAALELLEEALA